MARVLLEFWTAGMEISVFFGKSTCTVAHKKLANSQCLRTKTPTRTRFSSRLQNPKKYNGIFIQNDTASHCTRRRHHSLLRVNLPISLVRRLPTSPDSHLDRQRGAQLALVHLCEAHGANPILLRTALEYLFGFRDQAKKIIRVSDSTVRLLATGVGVERFKGHFAVENHFAHWRMGTVIDFLT